MITPRLAGNRSSFRSEVAGVYGLLLTLWYLLEGSTKPTGRLKVACNGKLVLNQLHLHKTIDPFAAHSNLLQASHTLMTRLPCGVTLQHVRGHQDNSSPTVLLREAWLNIKVDSMAKSKINPAHIPGNHAFIPFKPWHLLIGMHKIVKNHKKAL